MALARSQHGVLTRPQLVALGMTARQIGWRLDQGELRTVHRGIYLVGPTTPEYAIETAAVLACGPTACVSHESATHVYGLLPYPAKPGPIHITVTERHSRRRRGIHLHRGTTLRGPHELRERDGVPVTAPIRTLIDFAASAGDEDLERAVAEAFALRLVGRGQILRELDRLGPRPGTRVLRRMLDGSGPKRTRSRPERKLLALIRSNGLPEPETNVGIGHWEVDFLWREAGFAVEVDAYSTHSSPRAFERDRRKSAELEDLGLTVHRVTRSQLDLDPLPTIARIRRAVVPS